MDFVQVENVRPRQKKEVDGWQESLINIGKTQGRLPGTIENPIIAGRTAILKFSVYATLAAWRGDNSLGNYAVGEVVEPDQSDLETFFDVSSDTPIVTLDEFHDVVLSIIWQMLVGSHHDFSVVDNMMYVGEVFDFDLRLPDAWAV